MTTLMDASHQWSTRPDDERFVSLLDLQKFTRSLKERSAGIVADTKKVRAYPLSVIDPAFKDDLTGLVIMSPKKVPIAPTNWAFGQLCQRAQAPAGYLRSLPAALAADNLNYGLTVRETEEIGMLLRRNDSGATEVHAFTGPTYGRIWNADVVDAMVNHFGDGITGNFRVPGEFGKRVEVTKSNTTIYASDRDMFVFLADEERRIEVPNRRDGKSGGMARGFFLRNNEVGNGFIEITGFLFDYVCCNRIVWGAQDVVNVKIRHSAGGPARWMAEAAPALRKYTESSSATLDHALAEARKVKIDKDVREFLATRFTGAQATGIIKQFELEEHRPIETRWDAVVGITAFARSIPWQDERIKLEREAGKLMAV